MSKIAVAYSKTTGRIRWIILPDTDSELFSLRCAPGEGLLILDRDDYGPVTDLQLKVSEITKLVPANDRYCVVNAEGAVTNVIYADPHGCGDSVEEHFLIPHPEADQTWTYDHKTASFKR